MVGLTLDLELMKIQWNTKGKKEVLTTPGYKYAAARHLILIQQSKPHHNFTERLIKTSVYF
jgi:hypothetical protein